MSITLEDLLKLPVGSSKRTLVITGIDVKKVGETEKSKLILSVKEEFSGKTFLISDAYVKNNNRIMIQGLWINLTADGKINPITTLGKFLDFYNCSTILELEGKTITAYPDQKNYLVAIATPFPDTDHEINNLLV